MRKSVILNISDCLVVLLIEELRGKLTLTNQREAVPRSQQGRVISLQFLLTVVSQASFRREISDVVARYGLFSQAFNVKLIQRTL